MPEFQQVEVTALVDVSFEVFCSCGAHMCGETDTRMSRNRQYPQAVVNACQKCIDRATSPLEEKISDLEQEIESLRAQIQ